MKVGDDEKKKIELVGNEFVTITEMNHIIEMQYLEKRNNKQWIQKLDSDNYLVLETGEVKEFKKTENRSQNYSGLLKTFKRLRYLINNNFVGGYNELFITLTYAENMQDVKRLYDDFRKFIQRLRYKTQKDYGKLEYLDVIEPQERGAWHHHVLLKFPNARRVYLSNKFVNEVWGLGFVRVNRLSEVDNIGAYLTAYLTDLPYESVVDKDVYANYEVVEKETKEGLKKFIKGGRLHLYPTNVNFYRKSKGVVFPERRITTYNKVLEKYGEYKITYEKDVFLEIDEFKNKIKYRYYNKKR